MKTEKIINLYFSRATGDAEKEFEETYDRIVNNDVNVVKIKQKIDEINDILIDINKPQIRYGSFGLNQYLSQESKDQIDDIYKRKKEKESALNQFREEVEAQLSACPTYEHEMSVLRNYEIIETDPDCCGRLSRLDIGLI